MHLDQSALGILRKAEDKNGRKYMDWRIPYMDQPGLIMVYKSDSRYDLKTYFLKSLHFGNFKNSVLKWVINTEWIGSQEFQNRNYDKALYDFRQERLSENLTQNVIRRNR